MSYTNPWSDAIPVGTDAANTLDTIIQQVRLDVHQRMTTLIGSATGCSWTDDPVIDGSNALDLVSLTTLANSKTTLSGLTTGQLIQATGAASVGNAGITVAKILSLITNLGSTPVSHSMSAATTYTPAINPGLYYCALYVEGVCSLSGMFNVAQSNSLIYDITSSTLLKITGTPGFVIPREFSIAVAAGSTSDGAIALYIPILLF